MAFTARQRLRYWFDNTMSRGTTALIGWLLLASIVMIAVLSLLVWATGIAPAGDDGATPGFVALAWMALMRTLDAGTMGGDTGSWPFLIAMFAVTLGGVFLVSTLIGVLTSGIESRVEELRKGRSPVVERDHSVILGWSPEVFTVVSELVEANRNRRRAVIAILADKDKVEMEDEIRMRVTDLATTRVVCRSGNPMDLADLELVNPHESRAIVILAADPGQGDSHVIKTVLALTNNPRRRAQPYHIVASLREARNLQVARMVGGNEAQFVLAGDLIARLTVQTCRQSGLSVVYTELLDFGGDEIYFATEPKLTGRTFGEALLAYEDSAVIGLRRADGRVQVNPPMDTVLEAGDRVIAISEDDDTVRLSGRGDVAIDEDAIRAAEPRPGRPERTLLLGWNERAPAILRELDHYVGTGSLATVVTDAPEAEAALADLAGLERLSVRQRKGDVTDRALLDALCVQEYDHVITLSSAEVDAQEADGRTLVTLLHLRDIADRTNVDLSIVSEMRDVRNRALAEVTRADDFVVSDRMISLVLTQLAENRELLPVFEDLFDPEGSEIYLKPAADYVLPGRSLTFYTVVEAARRRGHCAIGYRLHAQRNDAGASYGVVVNPAKSEPLTFCEGDRIIVLAED